MGIQSLFHQNKQQITSQNTTNMSNLLNKAKDALGKSGSSGSGHTEGGQQQSSIEKGVSGQAHTQIDNLTDRAGLGDKYDDKINKFADGQINNQIPGGAGNNAGGSGGLGGLGK